MNYSDEPPKPFDDAITKLARENGLIKKTHAFLDDDRLFPLTIEWDEEAGIGRGVRFVNKGNTAFEFIHTDLTRFENGVICSMPCKIVDHNPQRSLEEAITFLNAHGVTFECHPDKSDFNKVVMRFSGHKCDFVFKIEAKSHPNDYEDSEDEEGYAISHEMLTYDLEIDGKRYKCID